MTNILQKTNIFLDHNATSPLRPQSLESIQNALSAPLNASSVHNYGRAGRRIVESARENIATLVGIPAPQIIFNSGATEGNNTVLKHFAEDKILVSAIEHPAVLEAAPNAIKIPVTPDGIIDLNALEDLLKSEKPALTSIMAVNNETGVIQPIKEASDLVHRHGSLLHCDAVQAAGRININMQTLGIDFLTLSAHKIGGPQGVGALALGLCGITPTLLHGGGQEKSARAGTENVAGIAGFGAAVEAALEALPTYTDKMRPLQDKLETALKTTDGLIIHGENAPRSPNTTLFSLPGVGSETMLMALDLDGIAISNGSACSSGRVEASHVLKAMGQNNEIAAATLRVSTGWNTLASDIDTFIASFEKIAARLKS
jgi:cysteine desulfurase